MEQRPRELRDVPHRLRRVATEAPGELPRAVHDRAHARPREQDVHLRLPAQLEQAREGHVGRIPAGRLVVAVAVLGVLVAAGVGVAVGEDTGVHAHALRHFQRLFNMKISV